MRYPCERMKHSENHDCDLFLRYNNLQEASTLLFTNPVVEIQPAPQQLVSSIEPVDQDLTVYPVALGSTLGRLSPSNLNVSETAVRRTIQSTTGQHSTVYLLLEI